MRKEELAAVWVPCGFTNAGDNFETFSMVESPLIPFSITRKKTRNKAREGRGEVTQKGRDGGKE